MKDKVIKMFYSLATIIAILLIVFITYMLIYSTILSSSHNKCDVNYDGVVTTEDAQLILDYSTRRLPKYIKEYDINCDGKINSSDALMVLQNLDF